MARILVQIPFSRRCAPAMATIARSCRGLGHRVQLWIGSLSTWIPNRLWLGPSDLAFVWNGAKPQYGPAVHNLREQGMRVIFVEHGWYPQQPTVQLDPSGINVTASWAGEPLAAATTTPLSPRSSGELLVLLQHDRDVQITQCSPWFANTEEFVRHLLAHSQLPLRIRQHPRHPASRSLRERVVQSGHRWDNSPSLAAALQSCRAVACINSSSAIEALSRRLPVLCYGQSIYRHPGAVYCLDNDPAATHAATAELAAGRTSLYVEPIEEALRRVLDHQFPINALPQLLPPMLQWWLHESVRFNAPQPAATSSYPDRRTATSAA